MKKPTMLYWQPLILSGVIIALDQITKYLVTLLIKPNTIAVRLFNNLLWIVHQRNTGVAFSLGYSAPVFLRVVLFIVFPLVILTILGASIMKSKDYTILQRWAIAGIIGGGCGNIVDRIFRAEGVVDFISVRFFGIFGLERWPTFNVADSSVVVCGIILFVSILFMNSKKTI